jgi:predicted PurR-regulated permease PerM
MELLKSDHVSGALQYFGGNGLYALAAIILGVLCEKIVRYLQMSYSLNPIVAIIIQLFLAILVLYVVGTYIVPKLGEQWQLPIYNLVFLVIFFNLQPSLYGNIFNNALTH